MIEEKENKEIVYNSSSPDEIALTNLARMFEYEYRGTNADNQICVRTKAGDQLYKLFYTLEFTSARKRQSTIFQDTDGSIWLYTKGADNVIFDKVKPSADPE